MPGNGRKEPYVDEIKLLSCLKRRHRGQDNAVKSSILEIRFNVSGRIIRDAVNILRCRGCPICSDENGYYYASNKAELAATIRQLNSRIGKIAKARDGLVRAARRYSDDGQTHLTFLRGR
jgi:transcriptional regulator of NAD metabolism